MIESDLTRAIAAEVAPCTGCEFAQRCKTERLACDQFALYSQGAPQRRWSNAPRTPTRARFEALFGD